MPRRRYPEPTILTDSLLGELTLEELHEDFLVEIPQGIYGDDDWDLHKWETSIALRDWATLPSLCILGARQ